MSQIDPMEFGELRAMAARTSTDVVELKAAVVVLADAVHKMQLTLAEARGGWKTFIGIGTAFFACGAMIWEGVRHFFK